MVQQIVATSPQPTYQIEQGCPHPVGATPDANGVNFSIYADRATAVSLLLFRECLDPQPFLTIELDLAVTLMVSGIVAMPWDRAIMSRPPCAALSLIHPTMIGKAIVPSSIA